MNCVLKKSGLFFSILLLAACDNAVSPASQFSNNEKVDVASVQENINAPPVKNSSAETKTNPLIEYQNGLTSVSAVDVSQLVLLEQLAKKAGFGLQINYRDWTSVSLTMTNLPAEDVIKAILGPIPHKIYFRSDIPAPARIIQRVSVGEESADVATNNGSGLAARHLKNLNEKNIEEDMEPEEPITKDQVMAMSDQEKVEFLPYVEPSAENFPVLVDVMKNYPNADVRIAAMASMENSESPETIAALVDLLDDADPKIVLAAIDSIEFAGSDANVKSLEPLLKHSNPAVQSAAREAIDFLR